MKEVFLFDEKGNQYKAEDVDRLIKHAPKEDLGVMYKATYFHHDLNRGVSKLIEVGLVEQVEGEPYDVELYDKQFEIFKEVIIDKYGQETLDGWTKEVDDYMEKQTNNG